MTSISEKINQMIQRILESAEWTSANPTHINRLIQVNSVENPDFESDIEEMFKKGSTDNREKVRQQEKENKKDKVTEETKTKLEALSKGNLGEIKKMSTETFGNLKGVATNPLGFIIGKLGTKLVRGGIIMGLVFLIQEIIFFVISEGMKPNRWLDRRLRVNVEDQVLNFTRRQELANLRQGFKSVFVTASPFMRASAANIGSSLAPPPGSEIQPNFAKPVAVVSDVGAKTTRATRPGRVFGR